MRTAVRYFWILPMILFITMIGCSDNPVNDNELDFSNAPESFDTSGIEPVIAENGLIYYQIENGEGRFEVVERDLVWVHYTLRDSTGEIFDSSYRNGKTDSALFDLRKTIQGFRQGMTGMKVGGKRKIVIPPGLGYTKSQDAELGNKTLYFDVELDKIASN